MLQLTITLPLSAEEAKIVADLVESQLGVTRQSSTGQKAAPKAKAAPVAVAPDPEPEAEEDLLGTGEPTLEDAVARATALVGDGRAADVKAALAKAGAKRVSELAAGKIAGFLAALSD